MAEAPACSANTAMLETQVLASGLIIRQDVTDLCLIQFSDDTSPDFFRSPYVIEERTVATSQAGHVLCVAGVLKDKTSIVLPDIDIGYCRLEFQDAGPCESDPFLRRAEAQ